MRRIALAVILLTAMTGQAFAGRINNRPIPYAPWHGQYFNTNYGRPVALVVPPTARFETTYGWGVGHTEMYPLEYQFGRRDPGAYGGQFSPTPMWPSHTEQFGTYYMRGPW